MFEVILTLRPNFTEKVAARYASADEAHAAAERLAVQQQARIIRVWVRHVREARTQR
jgi:hypothetical protein